MASKERMVPHDIDAEEQVLGAMLLDSATVPLVATIIQPGDFFRESHRWIYEACLTVHERMDPVHQVSVARELANNDRLDEVGGVATLAQLVANCVTSVYAEDYASAIRAAAFQRRLIHAGGQIAKIGYEGGDPSELLGKAQEQILALTGMTGGEGFRTFREIASESLGEITAWVENPQRPRGVSTGFADLDGVLGGLQRGTYYALAARTSMGKSQLAEIMAINVARQGVHVGIFALEMTRKALLERATFAVARLDRTAISLGQAPDGWRQRFWDAYGKVEDLPISVDSTDSITVGTARARTAQLKAQYPKLGLIIFDYGELAGDENRLSEEKRMSDISRRLQALAHGLDLPVVGVFQLSRKVEDRPSKVPELADLRYSGMIEQSADVVMLLFRKAYYARQDSRIELAPGEEKLLEVLIAKHRNGPTGKVRLYYDTATGFIGNWTDDGQR